MTESKPREFWIYSFKSGRTQISESKVTIETQFYAPYDDPTRPLKPSEVIHAIEHSAFEQLKKENELLKHKLEVAKKLIIKELKDIDCSCGADNGSSTEDVICYLHEALKEIEEMK